VPQPTFSTMRVAPGQTNTISYNHETGHVVRYVHGTCSTSVPWVQPRPDLPPDAVLFPQLQRTILSTLTCVTDRCGEILGLDLINVDQIDFEAQPHFRGLFNVPVASAPRAEMGFYFDARYDERFATGGVTVHMNPGYAIQKTVDGFVSVAMINDDINTSNVSVTNNGISGNDVAAMVRDQLRFQAPFLMTQTINKRLTNPLPPQFGGVACEVGSSTAPDFCFDQAMAKLGDICFDGHAPEACIATTVFSPANFSCMANAAGGGTCAFRPIVQQVNVLPESLELVFAPDPNRPFAQLDRVFRALETASIDPMTGKKGVQLCMPPLSVDNRVNQPLAMFQSGEDSFSPPDCGAILGPDFVCDPPEVCGNRVVDGEDVCDDGNTNNCGSCNEDCSAVNPSVTGCANGFGCVHDADCASNTCSGGVCTQLQ
jgi:hypothetical protein